MTTSHLREELLTYEQLLDLKEQWERMGGRLANALETRYEKGTPVIVFRGGKEFRGTVVAGPCTWHDPCDLLIESRTGWRFRANFKDVEEQP